jgi:hypothetical protein
MAFFSRRRPPFQPYITEKTGQKNEVLPFAQTLWRKALKFMENAETGFAGAVETGLFA